MSVKPKLHGAPLRAAQRCAIILHMATQPHSRRKTYIREWRKHRGLTQAAVISRIIELAGEGVEDDPNRRVPKTEASLSRIETGKQPYTQAVLEVLADVFDAKPAWLLERDPTKEGKVLSILERLSPAQFQQAEAVLEALLRTAS